jgi:hypothetical protein
MVNELSHPDPSDQFDDNKLIYNDIEDYSIEELFDQSVKIAMDAEIMWSVNHTGGVSTPLNRESK